MLTAANNSSSAENIFFCRRKRVVCQNNFAAAAVNVLFATNNTLIVANNIASAANNMSTVTNNTLIVTNNMFPAANNMLFAANHIDSAALIRGLRQKFSRCAKHLQPNSEIRPARNSQLSVRRHLHVGLVKTEFDIAFVAHN